MTSAPRRALATLEELYALPEQERYELIRGTVVEREAITAEQASAQAGTTLTLGSQFQRRGGGPGGWWFLTEMDLSPGAELYRPDVCGYRRERVPVRPRGRPVTLVPDWVCEVLPPPKEARDRIDKLQMYFRFHVPHYWLVNPVEGTLEVYRRIDLAFALVLTARRGERIRAEPFDAVELSVDELLGNDPPDSE